MLTDFGYAKNLSDDPVCTRMCGTKGYIAPEILLRKPYSYEADIWSLGALMYSLVARQLPFPVLDEDITKQNLKVFANLILDTELTFEGDRWSQVSDELKDLIRGMLEKSPSKRLKINEVLSHSWLQQ